MEKEIGCRVRRIHLENLLGVVSYDITLSDPVTFITAPNGCGKTTLLNMLSFMFDPNDEKFQKFWKVPFGSFICELTNGRTVELRRMSESPSELPFMYMIFNKDGSVRHMVNYCEDYENLHLWYMGKKEKQFLEESGCRVKVNYPEPCHFIYDNYLADGGTKYTWEKDDKRLSDEMFRLFEQIFNKKNIITGKTVSVDRDGIVLYSKGERTSFRTMSGGERHLFALFYNLIFNAHDGVVLIDAPEREMHVEWQEAFIDDVLPICKMNGLQVIMTTHSPNIVNGYREFFNGPIWI